MSLQNKLHRPQYHFLPEKNWMNDPNGLIQWNGQFHLFYQYNPNGAFHGTIHWGHAVSSDLVHWQRLPIALAPTPEGPDKDGCYSGCAINNEGTPTFVYTGISPQTVCLATSSDGLLSWEKYEGNPVIDQPPPGVIEHATGDFRDPYVWRENDKWFMVIGSKREGQGGLVLFYQSQDLVEWEYLGIFLAGDVQKTKPFWTGTVWECPNLLEIDGKRVLIVSAQNDRGELMFPFYHICHLQNLKFTSIFEQKLVYGNCFYAPQVMKTDDGRWVMFGWLQTGRRSSASTEAGWSGVMSLPMSLSLLPDNRLEIQPVEELKSLRQTHWKLDEETSLSKFVQKIKGASLEILLECDVSPDAEFGIKVCCSPDFEEQTQVIYDSSNGRLLLNKTQSSLSTVVDRDMQKAPLQLGKDEKLRLHIFVDHSTLELFANNHVCMASRIYPTREDSLMVDFFVQNGTVNINSLDVWEMKPIW